MTIRQTASKVTDVPPRPGHIARRSFDLGVLARQSFSHGKFLVLALAAALYACGGAADAPKDGTPPKSGGSSASKSASSNPWGGFKVGSFVKTKTTVSAQVMGRSTDTSTETKTTLADLTPDKAVLDIETTMMGNTTKT